MEIAGALGLLVGVGLIAWSVGRVVLKALLGSGDESWERAVFSTALGLGLVAYLVLGLGLFKLARPVALWLAVLIVGSLALARQRPGLTRRRESTASGLSALLVAVGFGLVGLVTLAGALAPPTQWDELAYHLAVPKVFLREGRIFFVPYDHHSNFPFTLQMLYTLMLSAKSVLGAKLVHWLYGLLLVVSVGLFCKRHFGDGGPVAAGIVVASPLVLWEATTAYIDLGTTLYVWLAFYGLANSTPSNSTPSSASVRWLWVSALCMGFALGTKATVLGFWGLLLVGFALRRAWKPGALWGVVSLGVGAVWYIKSWFFAGNPVYPFAYALLGGRYWSVQNAAQYAAEQGRFGFGKDPLSLLLSPIRVAFERFIQPPEGRLWSFTEQAMSGVDLGVIWLFGLVFALMFWKKLPISAKAALRFALGIWLFWFLTMQQGRYLLPALPLLAVATGAAYSVASRPVKVILGAVVAIGVGGSAWTVQTARLDRATDLIAACSAINASAAPTDKVGLFDEVRGFYLDREYVWAQPDHAEGLIPWDSYKDADDWLADFKKRGYVWLLCGPGGDDGRRWRQLFNEALSGDRLIEAETIGRYRVYRVP
jgi:hypothetical protein